jgi:hypothetical protein
MSTELIGYLDFGTAISRLAETVIYLQVYGAYTRNWTQTV